MSIDKIGSVNNISDYSKINSTGKTKKTEQTDSIHISNQATELSEQKRIIGLVNESPDVRVDRVKELKAKINDPNYITNKMVETVADRIFDNLI